MDDLNITIEEYIRLEEEKAQRHGQTFNWQTATFGKVENYEDEDDCSIDFKTEFPAIVFDNTLTTIPSEPTVCPPNENKATEPTRRSTGNFDENSFSYKIIYVNDLKTDSENDNMPSSPNPTVDYLDDLDYFKDFGNEFPAIVYNDDLTSKSDLEINPLVSSECIDKFNLIDEASLSEYDEKIVSCFNDLFNIIHPDDSKSEKNIDDNDIGIIQSSKDNEITHGKNGLSKTSHYNTIRTFETGSFVMNLKGFAAALAVLVTGASQSRQHESHHRFFPVDTSLIQIESRKSPTKSLIDVGSRRISIFTVNTKEYHSDVLAIITRIMRRT
ncbi:hypothetical protein Tco_1400443 [Tanacetum coccineum]